MCAFAMQFKRAIDPIYNVDLDLQEDHHGSIMIVDDEVDILDVIRQSLERDGFNVLLYKCIFSLRALQFKFPASKSRCSYFRH